MGKNQAEIGPKRPFKAIVAEDEDITRSIHELYLGMIQMKYPQLKFATAANGLEALDGINETIDLLITDGNMPKMDGFTLIQEARRRHQKLYVIMVTSNNDEKSKLRAKDLGVKMFILKPMDYDSYSKAVFMAMDEVAGNSP